MILEGFLQALQSFGSIDVWLAMIAGVIVGMIFGIIPGIGGIVALALFLPFAFTLPPTTALTFMISVLAVCAAAGSISAIVLNMPGTPPNAATLIDGFPMTLKGEGARAIGAAQVASASGSVLTVFIALAMVPLVLPMILALRSPDMVFIILMGLSFIAVLGKGSMINGLISGGIGLVISFVGFVNPP